MSFLFDAILIFAFTRSAAGLMVSFWCLNSFGALTILPPEWIGGVNILVGTVAALLFATRVLFSTSLSRVMLTALDFKRLGFLTTYTGIGLVSAIILPRLMSHVWVFGNPGGDQMSLVAPNTGNINQTVYLLASFFTSLAFALFMQRREGVAALRVALLAGAAILVLSGIVDIIVGSMGATDALDVFRTANYTFMLDNNVMGVRRTIGFMTEASSFGSACIFWAALLLFTRHMFPKRQLVWGVTPLALLCVLLAVLSTSSAAYLALMVTLVLFGCDCLINLFSKRFNVRIYTLKELYVLFLAFIVFIIILLGFPDILQFFIDMIDELVFKKGESSSFEERTAWTNAAFAAFFDSFGIGVGIGSVRTSNLFVNILASTGVIGSFLFISFLYSFYSANVRNAPPEYGSLLRGAKMTTIPIFAQAALVGTMPDYGAPTAALFGIVIGIAAQKPSQAFRTESLHRPYQEEPKALS